MSNRDRYLKKRGETWYYQRGVPKALHHIDNRAPLIQESLKTRDRMMARKRRDGHMQADNRFWDALKGGMNATTAREKYEADIEIARTLGVPERSTKPFNGTIEDDMTELARRVVTTAKMFAKKPYLEMTEEDFRELAQEGTGFRTVVDALAGRNPRPSVTVTDAFKIYVEEIAVDDYRGMNAEQFNAWRKVKQRAVNNFTRIVYDKPILEITREDAKDFHKWWRSRITPPASSNDKPLSASAGNRDIGNMRKLFKEYAEYMGDYDTDNPFRDFGFKRQKRKRPAFSLGWVKSKFLNGDGLIGLNDDARHLFLLGICFGSRPSEIANIAPSQIHLDPPIPYIEIAAIDEGEHKRAVKNDHSQRSLPLTGLALKIMRLHPEGFPRYRGKANSLSAVVMKHLKTNCLLETPEHKAYSIRHAFENAMKEANIGDDMRRELMGHGTVDNRPDYGDDYSLQMRLQALQSIALPYDPAII